MYNIYIIKNKINDKVYIGKTSKSIEERFRVHKYDMKKYKSRKLYKAMNELGFENFYIEKIDETDSFEKSSELEIKYIKEYNSYKNGYNGDCGGDGSKLIDEETWNEILDYVNEKKDFLIFDIAKKFNIDSKTAKNFLEKNNITINKFDKHKEKIEKHKYKTICCYDKNGFLVKTFNDYASIKQFVGENLRINNILRTCDGKRKTAYGYIWKGF